MESFAWRIWFTRFTPLDPTSSRQLTFCGTSNSTRRMADGERRTTTSSMEVTLVVVRTRSTLCWGRWSKDCTMRATCNCRGYTLSDRMRHCICVDKNIRLLVRWSRQFVLPLSFWTAVLWCRTEVFSTDGFEFNRSRIPDVAGYANCTWVYSLRSVNRDLRSKRTVRGGFLRK